MPAQECPPLIGLRTLFLDHVSKEQALKSEQVAREHLTGVQGDCAVLVECHMWASHMRAADFGFDVPDKYARFNRGIAKMDSLVRTHPDLEALRALRMGVTASAPRFLVDGDGLKADAEAAIRVSKTDFWAESPKFSAWMTEQASEILGEQHRN